MTEVTEKMVEAAMTSMFGVYDDKRNYDAWVPPHWEDARRKLSAALSAALSEGQAQPGTGSDARLVWIIENTSQVRVRDIALELLNERRAAIPVQAEPIGYVTRNELTKLRLGVSCVDLFGNVVPTGFEMVPLYLHPPVQAQQSVKPLETQEYTLRAMAQNYTGGHSWDHLDGDACTKAADEIRYLRRALSTTEGFVLPQPAVPGEVRRPSYQQIIDIVQDCVRRMQDAGESHRMMAKWISEGINAALPGDAVAGGEERQRKALEDAYIRGATWYRQNEDFGGLLRKAAQDYADCHTSPAAFATKDSANG